MNRFKIVDSDILLFCCAKMPLAVLEIDVIDLFNTRCHQPFSHADLAEVLRASNSDVPTSKFSDNKPFWTFMVM